MKGSDTARVVWVLRRAPFFLFVLVLIVFGSLSPNFRDLQNFLNIAVQSSSTAIVAVGMTFVLLTAGVDLSVGAIMFVGAAVAGKMMLSGVSLSLATVIMLVIASFCGALNALFVSWLRLIPFVVTLATLYFHRGLGLWITETRAMNLPAEFLQVGSARFAGVPVPLIILALVVLVAHVALRRTPFGRQLYAIGHDAEAARKAGINTRRILFTVYVISGLCAGIGGVVALAQLAAVSPTFGHQKEFQAIAAAVLGGTSLFGGRGNVWPGTVLGAMLIHTVENGLNILNANPYIYPVITSAVIFLAVFIDSVSHTQAQKLSRRSIRLEKAGCV
jgi:ribose transport system permease protein